MTKQAKINFLAANSIPRNIGKHVKDETKVQKYIKSESQVPLNPINYTEVLIINHYQYEYHIKC